MKNLPKVIVLLAETCVTLTTAHEAGALRVPSHELEYFAPWRDFTLKPGGPYFAEAAGREPRKFIERKWAHFLIVKLGRLAVGIWGYGLMILHRVEPDESLTLDPTSLAEALHTVFNSVAGALYLRSV